MIYVLIREDQNDHGYIDASISGIFRSEPEARGAQDSDRAQVQQQGLRVEGEDDVDDGDWQVSWRIEEHTLRTALKVAG